MPDKDGLLDLDGLGRKVDAGEIDTVLVVMTDPYGRFMGKRLDAGFFLGGAARHGTHVCKYLLTANMEMEPVSGYRLVSWGSGYGDFHLVPDLGTLRVASWLDRTAFVICDVRDEAAHAPVAQAPRAMLRRQVDAANAAGYRVMAASELEYYIFRDSYRTAAAKGHRGLEAAGWYIEDYHALQGSRTEDLNGAARRHLARSGVPVESTKGEWGVGQHELNLRYGDVLEMADRHAISKQCLKELADRSGLSVTFMAKYASDQAGSGCHVHLSLWDGPTNAFGGGTGAAAGGAEGSDLFRWFLGGWIAHVPEVMAFYAPTVNAYKRFQASSFAPTRLAWSRDNRTAGFRVVGDGPGLRIECRIPGADCNPYLVYAAAIASGLDGIARRIEPPAAFEGDAYAAGGAPHVPGSLREAVESLDRGEFARRAFGDEVVEHYVHFFRTEQQEFDRSVTDWERSRYFERI